MDKLGHIAERKYREIMLTGIEKRQGIACRHIDLDGEFRGFQEESGRLVVMARCKLKSIGCALYRPACEDADIIEQEEVR